MERKRIETVAPIGESMNDCIFCKIISGQLLCEKLGETQNVFAFSDIQPQAPLHALLISKEHVASLNNLTPQKRREILPEMYDLADQIVQDKGLRERGYRTVINNQKEGGQVVFHLHMHVLAGAKLRGHIGA